MPGVAHLKYHVARELILKIRAVILHIAVRMIAIIAAGSAPYRRLLAAQEPPRSSLLDAFRVPHPVAGREEGTVHFFTCWKKGARMDWILANEHFEVVTAEIDHTRGPNGYPSDHFPVAAVLRFTKPR